MYDLFMSPEECEQKPFDPELATFATRGLRWPRTAFIMWSPRAIGGHEEYETRLKTHIYVLFVKICYGITPG